MFTNDNKKHLSIDNKNANDKLRCIFTESFSNFGFGYISNNVVHNRL